MLLVASFWLLDGFAAVEQHSLLSIQQRATSNQQQFLCNFQNLIPKLPGRSLHVHDITLLLANNGTADR